jgi:hypothetical protein
LWHRVNFARVPSRNLTFCLGEWRISNTRAQAHCGLLRYMKIYRRCAFEPLIRFDTGQRSRYLSARASDARLLRLGYWSSCRLWRPFARLQRSSTRHANPASPSQSCSRIREADAVIISGSETDVCVLAIVLSAVDLGYGRHLPSPRHPDAARSCYEGTNGTRGARAGDARVWELVQS